MPILHPFAPSLQPYIRVQECSEEELQGHASELFSELLQGSELQGHATDETEPSPLTPTPTLTPHPRLRPRNRSIRALHRPAVAFKVIYP